ncbi:unnamed protein product [Moneuplotes crassus]|uniref:Uncharacterized protein n=1 Tax=Euplotes crassus TaxID=5936 RepID=A0AAD1XNR0_EUPCR|nr:unnamed protein product [Moneuplotes crassus]
MSSYINDSSGIQHTDDYEDPQRGYEDILRDMTRQFSTKKMTLQQYNYLVVKFISSTSASCFNYIYENKLSNYYSCSLENKREVTDFNAEMEKSITDFSKDLAAVTSSIIEEECKKFVSQKLALDPSFRGADKENPTEYKSYLADKTSLDFEEKKTPISYGKSYIQTLSAKRVCNSAKRDLRSKLSQVRGDSTLYSNLKKGFKAYTRRNLSNRNKSWLNKSATKTCEKLTASQPRVSQKNMNSSRSRNRVNKIGSSKTSCSNLTDCALDPQNCSLQQESSVFSSQNQVPQDSALSPREWIKKMDRRMDKTIKLSRINLYNACYPP